MQDNLNTLIPAIEIGHQVQFSSVANASCIGYRLHYTSCGIEGGWATHKNDINQWIQVSSELPREWVAISTQGKADSNEWITTYCVKYTMNGGEWFLVENGRVFKANDDSNTVVTNYFNNPVKARAIRLVPLTYKQRMSLRWEVYYKDEMNCQKI